MIVKLTMPLQIQYKPVLIVRDKEVVLKALDCGASCPRPEPQ